MANGKRRSVPHTIYRYEPEADVLSMEVSRLPIDYAEEMGNIIVHFSPRGKPVLLELLNASHVTTRMHALTRAHRARPRAPTRHHRRVAA